MSPRFIRVTARLHQFALCAMGIYVVYWAMLPVSVEPSSTLPVQAHVGFPSPPEIPDYRDIASLLNERLRGPLYDPPPPPPPSPDPPPAPIRVDVKLIGTVLEPGRDQALLRDPNGKLQFCGVGETVDLASGGFVLESVTETGAILKMNSPREFTIQLTLQEERKN